MMLQKLTILVITGLVLLSGLTLGFATHQDLTEQNVTHQFQSPLVGEQIVDKVGVQKSSLAQETQTTTAIDQTETETEPNNNPGEATVLESGTRLSGTIPTTEDRDFFVFNASEGEQINIEMTHTEGDGSLGLVLYSAELNFISGTSIRPGENTELVRQVNQTGKYYLSIGTAERGIGSYTLALNPTEDSATVAQTDTTPTETTAVTPPTSPRPTITITTPDIATTTENATDQDVDGLSDEQRQAIASGVSAGVNDLQRIGIEVSRQERELVIMAAIDGADPRTNPLVLEEAVAGITFGVMGEGATESQLQAAVRGAMAGVSRVTVEQQNISQLNFSRLELVVNEAAMGAARGAVVGGVQNQNVSTTAIKAAATGTVAGGIDGAMTNQNATLNEVQSATLWTAWGTTNLAAQNSQLTADDLEQMAYVYARTNLLEFPEPP